MECLSSLLKALAQLKKNEHNFPKKQNDFDKEKSSKPPFSRPPIPKLKLPDNRLDATSSNHASTSKQTPSHSDKSDESSSEKHTIQAKNDQIYEHPEMKNNGLENFSDNDSVLHSQIQTTERTSHNTKILTPTVSLSGSQPSSKKSSPDHPQGVTDLRLSSDYFDPSPTFSASIPELKQAVDAEQLSSPRPIERQLHNREKNREMELNRIYDITNNTLQSDSVLRSHLTSQSKTHSLNDEITISVRSDEKTDSVRIHSSDDSAESSHKSESVTSSSDRKNAHTPEQSHNHPSVEDSPQVILISGGIPLNAPSSGSPNTHFVPWPPQKPASDNTGWMQVSVFPPPPPPPSQTLPPDPFSAQLNSTSSLNIPAVEPLSPAPAHPSYSPLSASAPSSSSSPYNKRNTADSYSSPGATSTRRHSKGENSNRHSHNSPLDTQKTKHHPSYSHHNHGYPAESHTEMDENEASHLHESLSDAYHPYVHIAQSFIDPRSSLPSQLSADSANVFSLAQLPFSHLHTPSLTPSLAAELPFEPSGHTNKQINRRNSRNSHELSETQADSDQSEKEENTDETISSTAETLSESTRSSVSSQNAHLHHHQREKERERTHSNHSHRHRSKQMLINSILSMLLERLNKTTQEQSPSPSLHSTFHSSATPHTSSSEYSSVSLHISSEASPSFSAAGHAHPVSSTSLQRSQVISLSPERHTHTRITASVATQTEHDSTENSRKGRTKGRGRNTDSTPAHTPRESSEESEEKKHSTPQNKKQALREWMKNSLSPHTRHAMETEIEHAKRLQESVFNSAAEQKKQTARKWTLAPQAITASPAHVRIRRPQIRQSSQQQDEFCSATQAIDRIRQDSRSFAAQMMPDGVGKRRLRNPLASTNGLPVTPAYLVCHLFSLYVFTLFHASSFSFSFFLLPFFFIY